MKRRGQNEGSIYRRKDGRWLAVVNLGWRDGRRWRKSFYGETRREVQEKLTAALRSQQLGLPIPGERQTVGQFLEKWLTDSVKSKVRPRTYESYSELIRVHIAPAIGKRPLVKLNPQDVQGFLNLKMRSGLSARTVQYLHAVLRSALNQALRWGFVPRNVATLVTAPRVEKPEIKPFTPEKARAFLAAVRGDRLEALYSTALALGLRRGEALGIHWTDLDLNSGRLMVRTSLQRIDGKLQLTEVKTFRSRRPLFLPKVAVEALKAHRQRQEQERLLAGSRWQETGLVFTSRAGRPHDPRNALRQFHRFLALVGIPRQRFHDLRHTCATLLLVQGVSPRTVMEILGHSQIRVTFDTYSHVLPVTHQEAMDKMDEILSVSGHAAARPN